MKITATQRRLLLLAPRNRIRKTLSKKERAAFNCFFALLDGNMASPSMRWRLNLSDEFASSPEFRAALKATLPTIPPVVAFRCRQRECTKYSFGGAMVALGRLEKAI